MAERPSSDSLKTMWDALGRPATPAAEDTTLAAYTQHTHLSFNYHQHHRLTHAQKDSLAMRVLELSRNDPHGKILQMSRKDLLDAVRRNCDPPKSTITNEPAASGTDAPLTSRDVRKVDPFFSGKLEPVILVRHGCILLALGRADLRAIILFDRMYFILPDGADSLVNDMRKNLAMLLDVSERKDVGKGTSEVNSEGIDSLAFLSEGAMPFEFAALEAMLMQACADLHKQVERRAAETKAATDELTNTVLGTRVVAGSKQLEKVLKVSEHVRELMLTAQALDRALSACLDEDSDMAAMFLTRMHMTGEVSADHDEVEILLESYMQEINASLSELENLSHKIEDTEKFVSLRLDSARNRLLKVDVFAGIAAAIFGFGSFIGSLFGMNLKTPLFERTDGLYFTFVCVLTAIAIVMAFCALVYFFAPPSRRMLIDDKEYRPSGPRFSMYAG